MSLSTPEVSNLNLNEDNLDSISKPISSGTLKSNLVSSPAIVSPSSLQVRNQGKLSELSSRSSELQNEINGIFEELCNLNRRMREDIHVFHQSGNKAILNAQAD